jgi:hypothetical protein
VAILSLALVYGLTCWVSCTNCLVAGDAAVAQSQGCGHAADGATGGAQQQAPAKPDCSRHRHSSLEAVQGDGLSQIQLSGTGAESQPFLGAVSIEIVNVASSFSSDLAPPQDAAISPQRKISILRI